MKKILGYKWKSQQTRRDNVERVIKVIGFGPEQDRMYCSHPIEGQMVVFYNYSPAHKRLMDNNLLEELFIKKCL